METAHRGMPIITELAAGLRQDMAVSIRPQLFVVSNC